MKRIHLNNCLLTLFLQLILLQTGCTDTVLPSRSEGGAAQLELRIGISRSDTEVQGTRAAGYYPQNPDNPYDFEAPANEYEKINTLRIIIVHASDNTVEVNAFNTIQVNSQPKDDIYGPYTYTVSGGETKHIYCVANEASIQPQVDFNKYTRGTRLSPSDAAALLSYNDWTSSNVNSPQAVPYIDNTGDDTNTYKFVPMSEFFDVEVESPTTQDETFVQQVNLFVTRMLVKFAFTASLSTDPSDQVFGWDKDEYEGFSIKSISFESLMQKEYLFPHNLIYQPAKYPLSDVGQRLVTSFDVPQYADNLIRPYTFYPENFGVGNVIERQTDGTYKTAKRATSYSPMLYFCETRTLSPSDIYRVAVEIEYPGLNGDKVTDTYTFDSQQLPNLPTFPRNTVVKIDFSFGFNTGLTWKVTLVPYAQKILNPVFGINTPDEPQFEPTEE